MKELLDCIIRSKCYSSLRCLSNVFLHILMYYPMKSLTCRRMQMAVIIHALKSNHHLSFLFLNLPFSLFLSYPSSLSAFSFCHFAPFTYNFILYILLCYIFCLSGKYVHGKNFGFLIEIKKLLMYN